MKNYPALILKYHSELHKHSMYKDSAYHSRWPLKFLVIFSDNSIGRVRYVNYYRSVQLMYKMSYICLINSHIKLDSSLNLGRVQNKKKMYSFQKNITTINSTIALL